MWAIALKDLRSLFLSPLAWVVLAVMQFILARGFIVRVGEFINTAPFRAARENAWGVTDAVVVFTMGDASLFLLILPLMTMRLISDERRNRTLPLLKSAPLTMTQIVFGKFLGISLFNLLITLLVALMPLSLLTGATIDLGKLATGILGLFLMLEAVAAAGLYFSTLTESPTLAAVGTYGLLLFLLLIEAAGAADNEWQVLLDYLSLSEHFIPFLKGIISSRDLGYYGLFIATFLILAVRHLDAERLGG